MVSGRFKSRSLRRVKVKTPSGKVVVHYRKRAPSPAKCANCSAILKGVPKARPADLKKLPKTARRPERPYGGVLCSRCSRRKIIAEARA